MAKQVIGIGASANDGTGDTIRDAFDKCNDNFGELYLGATAATYGSALEYCATRSPQLFDLETYSDNTYINYTNGATSSNAAFYTSDFIPVTAGLEYSCSYAYAVVWFNAAKQYISGTQPAAAGTFTAPANAAYLRVGGRKSPDPYHDLASKTMITQSASIQSWQRYGGLLNGEQIQNVATNGLADDAVTADKASFVVRGKNLFNSADSAVVSGYFMNNVGSLTASANYYVSHKIYVTPGTTYVVPGAADPKAMRMICAFDEFDRAVSASGSNTTIGTWTCPASGVLYIRFTGWLSYISAMQFEAAASPTAFEPYRYTLDPVIYTGLYPLRVDEPAIINQATLKHVAMFKAKTAASVLTQFNIMAIGDSYTQAYNRWTGKTHAALIATYGDAGGGWTGYGWFSTAVPPFVIGGTQPTGVNGNVRPSAYTVAYGGSWTCSYALGPGPDLAYITSSTAGDTIQRAVPATPDHTALRVVYIGTADGVVRHRVDSGSWSSNVNVQGTVGNIGYFDISLTAGAHTIDIEVVSGTVQLCGDNALSAATGVRLHKCGASGSAISQWTTPNSTQQAVAFGLLVPDVCIVMDGTNSQNAGMGYDVWKGHVSTMIDRFRAAVAYPDILIAMPPENGLGNLNSMSQYAARGRELAISEWTAFLDLQQSFGATFAEYASTSAYPLFHSDTVHPEPTTGGYIMDQQIRAALGL